MVYLRPGSKNYWFKFTINGERVQQSARTALKGEAKAREQEKRLELLRAAADGAPLLTRPKAKPTLAEYAPAFLIYAETAHATKVRTLEFYRENTRRLLEDATLAGSRLDRVDVEAYKGRLAAVITRRRKPLAICSRNRRLATLRHILQRAVEEGVITIAPKVRLLKGEERRSYTLPVVEQEAYLAACPQPLRDAALLALSTGLGPSELLSLQWSDVSLDPAPHAPYGFLTVRRALKRAARLRSVQLVEEVAIMLRRRKAETAGVWVFPGKCDGAHFTRMALGHMHGRVRKALGLSVAFTPYSWRHSAATRLLEAGADPITVASILGHVGLAMVTRYAHPTSTMTGDAFARLQAFTDGRRARGAAEVVTLKATR